MGKGGCCDTRTWRCGFESLRLVHVLRGARSGEPRRGRHLPSLPAEGVRLSGGPACHDVPEDQPARLVRRVRKADSVSRSAGGEPKSLTRADISPLPRRLRRPLERAVTGNKAKVRQGGLIVAIISESIELQMPSSTARARWSGYINEMIMTSEAGAQWAPFTWLRVEREADRDMVQFEHSAPGATRMTVALEPTLVSSDGVQELQEIKSE